MPTIEPLVMPDGYGANASTMSWADVSAQLVAAHQYWVATNRPGGCPHLVPVDGLWVDDVLYYGGLPTTLHVRAALADPTSPSTCPIRGRSSSSRVRCAWPSRPPSSPSSSAISPT